MKYELIKNDKFAASRVPQGIFVDAVQWKGGKLSETIDWLPEPDGLLDPSKLDTYKHPDGRMAISLPDGVRWIEEGWWILRSERGEILLCREQTFKENYDRV